MTIEAPVGNLPVKSGNGQQAINLRNPVQNVRTLKSLLEASKQQIAELLPRHLTPDRVMRVALIAVNKTPKLLECTLESVLQSVMQAASLGLDPGGALGMAYLVPYGNTCTLIPSYRGLIDLARRSGEISSINAEVVYKNDKFEFSKGLELKLVHEPNLQVEQSDEDISGAYMIARLKDGGTHVEYMNRQQIEKIRKSSRAGGSGPWKDHYSEMCRKTVVRRGCKYLPISSERFSQALEVDNSDTLPSMALEHRPTLEARFDQPQLQPHPTEPTQVIDTSEANDPAPIDDVPGTVIPPTANLTRWPHFEKAMKEIRDRDNVSKGDYDFTMGVVKMLPASKWPGIVDAAKNGALDWKTGQMV